MTKNYVTVRTANEWKSACSKYNENIKPISAVMGTRSNCEMAERYYCWVRFVYGGCFHQLIWVPVSLFSLG